MAKIKSHVLEEMWAKGRKGGKLLIDSGAFSAWAKGGIEIDIDLYIAFIKRYEKEIYAYINLDVIRNPEASWENQLYMEKKGLTPIPVFHKGEDFSWWEKYIERYDYIATGGIAGGIQTGIQQVAKHLDICFDILCDNPDRLPSCRVHGLGVSALRLIFRYPFYSVDFTTWNVTGRLGHIYVPAMENGEYYYTVNPSKIAISNRSPDRKIRNQHYNSMNKYNRLLIRNYVESKGFKLGRSEFFFVNNSYKLKENEVWYTPKEEREKRTRWKVERKLELGVTNSLYARDEINILYFIDLQKNFKKYPWPFKKPKARYMF